jgi:hypothetical protein
VRERGRREGRKERRDKGRKGGKEGGKKEGREGEKKQKEKKTRDTLVIWKFRHWLYSTKQSGGSYSPSAGRFNTLNKQLIFPPCRTMCHWH